MCLLRRGVTKANWWTGRNRTHDLLNAIQALSQQGPAHLRGCDSTRRLGHKSHYTLHGRDSQHHVLVQMPACGLVPDMAFALTVTFGASPQRRSKP